MTFETLNKSEKKVASAILADPEAATGSSIANLAKKAGVSEPSVNRFCKRFGTVGSVSYTHLTLPTKRNV